MTKEANIKQEVWGVKNRRGRIVPQEAIIRRGRVVLRRIPLNVAEGFKKPRKR